MSNKGNKTSKETLKILYGCRCMLTDIKTKKLEFHHIFKKEYGGAATPENGANLTTLAHQWLHYLESTNYELFLLVSDVLMCYKRCLDEHQDELIEEYQTQYVPRFIQEINNYSKTKTKRRRH